MDKMTDNYMGIIVSLLAVIVVGVFVTVFGLPTNFTLRVLGGLYLIGILAILLLKIPQDIGLTQKNLNLIVMSHTLLFIVFYFILTYSLNWNADKTYSFIMLFFYGYAVGLIFLSQMIFRKPTSGLIVGHASSAVCFRESANQLSTFIIFNKNHDLWLLPGGHLDIVNDEPYVVARHRILSELGYESTALEAAGFEMRKFETMEILNGCHGFYRINMGLNKCHQIHFDFAYVCILEKKVSAPKYENIEVDITGCDSSDAISTKLREAVYKYYSLNNTAIPTITFPPDIPDRIYSGLLYYQANKVKAV